RFQNPGGGSLSGAPWRVWADTWVGESRGGVVGSGLLPNLYHCAYLGLCTVGVPPADNHFIYAQQPAATVRIGNAQRAGGLPNPLFTFSISGLVLGDTGRGFVGVPFSPAGPASLPGIYPINGSFTSAEGYAVNVVPGALLVGDFVQLPKPDVLRDMPTSWLYDRNIGPAPICFATGPLDGDRASQEGDVLAREWSRVRSRPNLTSCVDTERRNGCADF
ncbi:MAG: hemagglutinin, partial [Gammaproteobacteria bacterium]|nr:hemagglutinin [Gammaproteobacteria bacterium]